MLKLLKAVTKEDIFIQRYEALMRRALALTGNKRAQAEDLVHDAFIQFTLRRSELEAIENTDAYLNRMLRNMHLSQLRRASIIEESRSSIADFDSAEMGLRAIDPREHMHVQDGLRQICQYACARKATSKAGCVLILRFFHSYYPSEIAQVMQTTRAAVDWWIQQSRREAKACLDDNSPLKLTSGNPPISSISLGCNTNPEGLLGEMRDFVFASRRGDCYSLDQLRAMYRAKSKQTIEVTTLAHLVSCARCLDEVNRLLGLPPLTERMAGDRLGRDAPRDDHKGGDDGGSGGSAVESKRRYQRRLKETIEHRPQELRIAVNGFVLGAQRVSAEFNKQVLSVNVDEPIGFVEVFSEQGVRLIFFDVDQPIDGTIEQTASAEFDNGRRLDLSLSFRGPWPALNVAYHDPTFEMVESYRDRVVTETAVREDPVEGPSGDSSPLNLWRRWRESLSLFWRRLEWTEFLQPRTLTALFAVMLIAAVVVLYRSAPKPPISASDLLQRAAASEEALAANRDQVVHRTIHLEERSTADQIIKRSRLEIWQSAAKGITARRLYDDNGTLLAGDWRRSDGVQTIYHHGARARLQVRDPKTTIMNPEEAWQLDPSARDFSALVNGSAAARVEELPNAYVVRFESSASASSATSSAPFIVSKAVLVLNRSDLHATEMSLVFQPVLNSQQARPIEIRFVEAALERRSPGSVAPAIFEPEPSLLSVAESRSPTSRDGSGSSGPGAQPPTSFVATPELELQVLKQLNQANALFGEQINLSRTPEGRLRVEGVVESDRRKADVLQSLTILKQNPALEIDIETIAEKSLRYARERRGTGTTSTGNLEAELKSAMPAEADLRAYLSQQKNLSGEALDQEVRRFGEREIEHARQARRHAVALKQIAERFSADDLRSLDEGSRAQWRSMIAQHARAAQRELETLRQELQPVFSSLANADRIESVGISGDSDLARAAKRLFELTSSVDEAVGRSFSVYSAGGVAAVKTVAFSQSLWSATALAQQLSRA